MVKTVEADIEESAEKVESLKELKTLGLHLDYILKEQILPAISKLPVDIKEKTAVTFSHYHKVTKKIIGYLWKTHLENKVIIKELEKDKDFLKKIEYIKDAIEEEVNEELGE